MQAYRDHYEQIAADDLSNGIQPDDHMAIEADRLLAAVGDVQGLAVCDGVGKGNLLERLVDQGARSVTGVDLAGPYLRRLAGRDDVPVWCRRTPSGCRSVPSSTSSCPATCSSMC